MGYNSSATTLNLIAKLTPEGKRLYVSNNGTSLITKFSLGDSDANYQTSAALSTGQVPAIGGNDNTLTGVTNGVPLNYTIKSYVFKDNTGAVFKNIEAGANTINTTTINVGSNTITGTNLTHNVVSRTGTTESLTNLYYSFGLPLTDADKLLFTATTSANNGFSDTSLSGFNTNNLVVIAINNDEYGEMLDGKAVNVNMTTSAGTFNIYSTFQKGLTSTMTQDVNTRETGPQTKRFGNNYALLFSDSIQKPNGNTSLSWATGFNTVKPFSVNRKEQYNYTSLSTANISADTAVGLVSLDKGFIVITHPTIVNSFIIADSSATTVTFNSVATEISQNITVIANRGEFGTSNNATYNSGDTVRISEIGLHSADGTLIALAKPSEHIQKTLNGFFAMGIKINL
jgi:hypothetical protein